MDPLKLKIFALLPLAVSAETAMLAVHTSLLFQTVPMDVSSEYQWYLPWLDTEISYLHVMCVILAFGTVFAPAVWCFFYLRRESGDPFFLQSYMILIGRGAGVAYLLCLLFEVNFIFKRHSESTSGPLQRAPTSTASTPDTVLGLLDSLLLSAAFLGVSALIAVLSGLVFHHVFEKENYA